MSLWGEMDIMPISLLIVGASLLGKARLLEFVGLVFDLPSPVHCSLVSSVFEDHAPVFHFEMLKGAWN